MNRKGFISLIVLGVVAIASVLGLTLFAKNTIDSISKEAEVTKLGATIYTTQLTDTMNTFRQQVNSSTANLNTELVAVSTTIHTYGTIATENTPLIVAKGGTGLSVTPSAGQFLYASGTTPAWKLLNASSGITITHTSTSVDISTQGIDTNAAFTWGGIHTFSSSTIHDGSSTFNATTTFNKAVVFNASTTGAEYIPKLASGVITATKSFSLTSATFTTIGTSTANGIASTTITLSGSHRVLLTFSGAYINSGTDVNSLTFTVDGTDVAAGTYGVAQYQASGANVTGNLSATFITVPLSAGSHIFRALVRTDTGTITVGVNNSGNYQWAFQVAELYN